MTKFNDPSKIGDFESALEASFYAVLRSEADSLMDVAVRLEQQSAAVTAATRMLSNLRAGTGRVFVSGVGKAGLVGQKIAATLSSTGTPALFMHPVEALHGDIGAVRRGDGALLLSYSGETVELIRTARALKRMSCEIISVTRSASSGLGQLSDVVLELGNIVEACQLGLTPSCTSTAMLAVGDGLALAVAKAHGFTEREFASNHPEGMLGLKFVMISEVMRTGSRVVCVAPDVPVREVVRRVSAAKTGAALIVDPSGSLIGIFTDGDLRRSLLNGSASLDQAVRQFASIPCLSIRSDASVADGLKQLHDRRIEDLPVIAPDSQQAVGLLCLKDIR